MLADLIASDNYINFNIKAAQILGLNSAVYIAEIINICNKAILKNKLDEDGFCTVDRNYVCKRTTITQEEQTLIDEKLSKLNIIKISSNSKNKVSIDLNVLASILTSEDLRTIREIKDISVLKTRERKLTQKQTIINSLKNAASHPNKELDQAYKNWIEGVYANPNGFLSKGAVKIFMQSVDDYAKGDLDLALKIIDIATVNGYKECQWAINVFEKDFSKNFYGQRESQQKELIRISPSTIIGDEVF